MKHIVARLAAVLCALVVAACGSPAPTPPVTVTAPGTTTTVTASAPVAVESQASAQATESPSASDTDAPEKNTVKIIASGQWFNGTYMQAAVLFENTGTTAKAASISWDALSKSGDILASDDAATGVIVPPGGQAPFCFNWTGGRNYDDLKKFDVRIRERGAGVSPSFETSDVTWESFGSGYDVSGFVTSESSKSEELRVTALGMTGKKIVLCEDTLPESRPGKRVQFQMLASIGEEPDKKSIYAGPFFYF